MEIEAEGQELILKSSSGNIAIIPKVKASAVRSLLLDGSNEMVNRYISTLPREEELTEDGSYFYGEKEELKEE